MAYQSENLHAVVVKAPNADIFDTVQSTTRINLKNYRSALFALLMGVGATGTATITVTQAQDSSGTGAVAMPFSYRRVADITASDVEGTRTDATASGFTTTAGSNQLYEIEVNAEELDADKPWVQVVMTEVVNSPVLGSVLAILGEPRYPGSTHLTALA